MRKRKYPRVEITKEMLESAREKIEEVDIKRTKASPIDTLVGILGEYAFAQYYFGDWKANYVGKNKGKPDFGNIEIKASAYPFKESLHLLVREDYAIGRQPDKYVQIVIDVNSPNASKIMAGTEAVISGWATHDEVIDTDTKDYGSKSKAKGGYECHGIKIKNLKPMSSFE